MIACRGVVLMMAAYVACSDGGGEDRGGDAAAGDAGAEDGRAASDADVADAGVVREAGACGCSYGFHQECAVDELCAGSFAVTVESTMCIGSEPRGGAVNGACSATSTAGSAAPCNAQCVRPETEVSPCRGMDDGAVDQHLGMWFGAIDRATWISNSPNVWQGFLPGSIEAVRNTPLLSSACLDFLGWTALGATELCRGAGTIQHGEPWDQIENRLFKVMRMPEDECPIVAGRLCKAALTEGIRSGTVAVARLEVTLDVCPNGLPFAPPCDGPGGLECAKARLATIIRAIQRPR